MATKQEIREAFDALEREGEIRDSGLRRNGKIVWETVPPDDFTGKPWPRRNDEPPRSQWEILNAIHEGMLGPEGGSTVKDLAARLGVTNHAAAGYVEQMKAAGLITPR